MQAVTAKSKNSIRNKNVSRPCALNVMSQTTSKFCLATNPILKPGYGGRTYHYYTCKHLPTRTSPTAMGQMSGGEPGLFLFKAVKLPPAKNLETTLQMLPSAKRFNTRLSDKQMDD
ncbi:hypothetical protein EMCRGX_G031499 [Ephydatia muelleri]